MTEHHVVNPLSTGVDYPTLAARRCRNCLSC